MFANNFANALRNEVVSSIDRNEVDTEDLKFIDKGERIKHRNNSVNILTRICTSSKQEQQPILWNGISAKNKWYVISRNFQVQR